MMDKKRETNKLTVPAPEPGPLAKESNDSSSCLSASTFVNLFLFSGLSGMALFTAGIVLVICFSAAFWPLAPLTVGGCLAMSAGYFAKRSLEVIDKPKSADIKECDDGDDPETRPSTP